MRTEYSILKIQSYGALVNNDGSTYSYNANEICQLKIVNGNTTEFFTDGSKILRSLDSELDIWYNYGVEGIHGITVNGIKYVFRKNVFGDVTHIYKLNEGVLELAAEYKYAAWGKCIVTEVDESGIGAINPIRYRGYYFDTESGLYYLNARYYDPETGRFISADETKFLDPNTVNGLNLYAYCVNNPVMNVDPSGTIFLSILIGFLVGAAVSFGINVVSQGVTKGWDRISWREAFSEAILGGVMGGLSVIGGGLALGLIPAAQVAGYVVLGLVSAVTGGFAAYTLNNYGKDDFNFTNAMLSVTTTLVQGIFAIGAGYVSAMCGLFNSLIGDKTYALLYSGLRALVKAMLSDPWKFLSEIFN